MVLFNLNLSTERDLNVNPYALPHVRREHQEVFVLNTSFPTPTLKHNLVWPEPACHITTVTLLLHVHVSQLHE